MCGIVGQVFSNVKPTCQIVDSAVEKIRHRGPDMSGCYASGQVWMGHVRLSILDVSDAARQPMSSADQRFIICYNGEVYNFKDLSRSQALQGLKTQSDTEVVLRLFAQLGVESIKLLNGMFSFAIYDRQENKIWLVRDRLGIKPLHYRIDDEGLSFASEIKALLELESQSPHCDLSSVHEWLYYGNTLGERTLYQGIKKLLPGHYLELDLETFRSEVVCYWSPADYADRDKLTVPIKDRIEQTRDLLEQAVARQLVSDVPVGVFLSGGIDSSAITAFASRHYEGKLATYSVGFDFDKGVNELPVAKEIAQLYGTDHHELHISGFEISDVVEKMVEHHDMPFSDAANIPLYLLCSQISDKTKVVLQGDGGDELFGGYSRYTTLSFYRTAQFLARIAGFVNQLALRNPKYYRRQRYIHALTTNSHDLSEVMASLLTEEDRNDDLTRLFASDFRSSIEKSDPFARYRQCQQRVVNEDVVNQMLLVDSMIILPDIFFEKVDRSTMAASVETRVPFLDHDLVDFCMRLPGSHKVRFGKKKWLLKKALEGTVPDAVLYGKKTGFGVPYGYWLRTALKPLLFDHLEAFQNANPGVLDPRAVQGIVEDHLSRRRDRSFLLWKMLNFFIWANRRKVVLTC